MFLSSFPLATFCFQAEWGKFAQMSQFKITTSACVLRIPSNILKKTSISVIYLNFKCGRKLCCNIMSSRLWNKYVKTKDVVGFVSKILQSIKILSFACLYLLLKDVDSRLLFMTQYHWARYKSSVKFWCAGLFLQGILQSRAIVYALINSSGHAALCSNEPYYSLTTTIPFCNGYVVTHHSVHSHGFSTLCTIDPCKKY